MGKPKHSNDTRGEQKGAQQHAEGQQGPKAREAFLAGISDHSRRDDETGRAANDPRAHGNDAALHDAKIANPGFERDGGHRLFENRVQHDEAEKNSEKNRIAADVHRHKHEREQFQMEGGRETHPALPQDPPYGTVKSGGQGGGNRSDEDRSQR